MDKLQYDSLQCKIPLTGQCEHNRTEASRVLSRGWSIAYLLFGLVDTLQVTASYVGAVEGLPHVLPVAGQDLALYVGTHRLDVVAPAGGGRSGERKRSTMWLKCQDLTETTATRKIIQPKG